ncbi:MAG: EAL domain-containing protein [Actinomycetota bacterium]|nr:EAL domain-containing protein [Actinomycetota bacterium]
MTNFLEVLRDVNMVVFCLLTLVCARQWGRERSLRWATGAFGSLAFLAIVNQALEVRATPGLLVWFGKAILLVLCVVPFMLYRFAAEFQRPPRWLRVLATSGTVVVLVASLALPSLPLQLPGVPRPAWWDAYRSLVLVQWTILFSTVGYRMWSASRHEARVPRTRMRLLAVAAAGVNAAVLLAGMGTGTGTGTVGTQLLVALIFLTSSLLFVVGLAPPNALVQVWQRGDHVAIQAGMADLVRAENRAEVCAAVLPHASLAGAHGAAIVAPTGEIVGTFGETDPPERIAELACLPAEALPVSVRRVDLQVGTMLMWTSRYAPFFGAADLRLVHAIGHFSDIVMHRCALQEAQRIAELELAFQATHDPLTGLPNRLLLLDRLGHALARREGSTSGVAVLFLDVDRFKLVNDNLGHTLGDEVLRTIGRRLRTIMRPGDTVARFGGDEFVVVVEAPFGPGGPGAIAERIAAELAAPMDIDGTNVVVTVSTGLATARPEDDAESLLRDADAAMYGAKEEGRDRYVLFDARMRRGVERRLYVEAALREAIDRHAIEVRYQPTVELATGRVVGMEALARIPCGDDVMLPDEFIPIAEETGLIIPLGALVLEQACAQVSRWQRELPGLEDMMISVNRSARELLLPTGPTAVDAALRSSGLDPKHLCLEITESVLLKDGASSARALASLKELGVLIAVDDFGTGYSSLTYLKRFPVDILKIDRTFVWGLGPGPDSRDRAIVASVIDLAHAFGLIATAEGVETPEQLNRLRQLGCELAQGYHLGVPMTADDATAWLVEYEQSARQATDDDSQRHRVLVVDDDPSVRTLLCLALEYESAYEVVAVASDGREAVASARHHQPDLVLLDLAMPGIGGLNALPLIRAVAPASVVVVVTGIDDPAIEEEARSLGAHAVVPKGGDPDRLVATVGRAIDAARSGAVVG